MLHTALPTLTRDLGASAFQKVPEAQPVPPQEGHGRTVRMVLFGSRSSEISTDPTLLKILAAMSSGSAWLTVGNGRLLSAHRTETTNDHSAHSYGYTNTTLDLSYQHSNSMRRRDIEGGSIFFFWLPDQGIATRGASRASIVARSQRSTARCGSAPSCGVVPGADPGAKRLFANQRTRLQRLIATRVAPLDRRRSERERLAPSA